MRDPLDGLFSDLLRRRRLAIAAPHLSDGRVLDFGCGVGKLAEWIEAERYLGVDPHQESLAMARAHHPDHEFLDLEGFERHHQHERFDTIASLAVIEHLANPGDWLKTMRIRLAPDGRMVLTTPHPVGGALHALGARVRLFSREGAEEHEELLGPRRMRELAAEADLEVVEHRRFLAGFNQLFILRKAP